MFYLYININETEMTTITITVNGTKAGEKIYFILNLLKSNFLKVIEMDFETIQDVLEGEKKGLYSISK